MFDELGLKFSPLDSARVTTTAAAVDSDFLASENGTGLDGLGWVGWWLLFVLWN